MAKKTQMGTDLRIQILQGLIIAIKKKMDKYVKIALNSDVTTLAFSHQYNVFQVDLSTLFLPLFVNFFALLQVFLDVFLAVFLEIAIFR